MKIWFIEIGEPLPVESGARLLRYARFSKYLAEKGNEVTWWTSTFSHAQKHNLYNKDTEVQWNGVKLKMLYCGCEYNKNVSFARIKYQRKYAKILKKTIKNMELPDLIVLPIPTIENAKIIADYAIANNIPYIIDIRDNWPDEYIRWLSYPLKFFAKIVIKPLEKTLLYVCRNASGIMGVSQCQLNYGLKFSGRGQGSRDKIFYLGYNQDNLEGRELEEARKWIAPILPPEEEIFTLTFIGTMGSSRDLTPAINAVKSLIKEGKKVRFVIAGSGDHLERYRKLCGEDPSFIFTGWIDRYHIKALMEKSNMLLAPYHPDSNMSLPTKYFEYMAAGLPVLSSCAGEAKELIESNNTGYHYDVTENKSSILEILQHCIENPEELLKKGKNAQRLFKEKYSFDKIFPEIYEYLRKILY